MADESQYSNKRKYEEQTAPPPPRRPTGFSSGPIPSPSPDPSSAPPPPSSYNSVPPPMDEIQIAKQKAQEIAARLLNSAEAKRPRVDNNNNVSSYDYGDKGFSSYPSDVRSNAAPPSSIPVSYGSFTATTKKIDIPNMRVGVIIGKGGETIKSLQLQSGAKIQVTRDMDADPNAATRTVDLTGTQDQISRAEELINEVLQEAETGGAAGGGLGGGGSRRMGGQPGADQFVMKIPNNKVVGLVIGKGGETIKSMQANTGARIQVIPLHLPPGDPTPERTLQIDGTSDQIEHAKQLVNEIISGENRMRNSSMGGGYQQQGYQARPPSSWAPPSGPPAQQYSYMQQGAYPGPPQYGQSPYASYPQQTSAGYASTWDQSSVPPSQQGAQGDYDYYGQQQSHAPNTGGSSAPPTDPTGYNYYQGYGQAAQGYQQDGYGGYSASQQSGYGQAGYDQQQGGYGSTTNPGQEEDTSQAAPASSAPSGQEPTQGSTGQAGYGAAPTSQAGYSSQPPTAYSSGYGAPPPAGKPPAYAQNQQSPGAPGSYGYAQPAASGYGQPPAYGYGQAPQGYGSYGGYTQPPAAGGYSSDGSAGTTAPGSGGGGTPASQTAPPAGPPKASPKS
ncbi:unnamed protein product [Eruca vesicaria subsp. sativa]|uniref:K Homology domain-containing protein n=1 Tax=Eruca vesicaria subsp. sativa TaxID=29727 RepID=A0ABC8K3C6_ERUVS|nr:unnamed protein product [Eruca vesicaria subsp. sativa]